MNNQYKVSVCAHVENGRVEYYKEYTFKGRIVSTERISCAEFVRLLNPWNTQAEKEKNRRN